MPTFVADVPGKSLADIPNTVFEPLPEIMAKHVRSETMPVDLPLYAPPVCLDSDSSEEEEDDDRVPEKSPSGGRATTLPVVSASDLMQLFQLQDEAGTSFAPEFGRPYRQLRTHSKEVKQGRRAMQVESQFSLLAEKLRQNSFDFLSAAGAKSAEVQSQPFSPEETVIIFDWDDTLCPTWYIEEVVNVNLGNPQTWDNLPDDSPFLEPLYKHSESVRAILQEASAWGRVGIVTLAQRPWVVTSANKYLPWLDVERLLAELDIPVIYARECLKRHMVSSPEFEEGVCPWTLAKAKAMQKMLKKLYGKRPWQNVLSIGDSMTERNAITDLLWGHSGDSRTCCKTLKLMSDPTVQQLQAQLDILKENLATMAQQEDDLSICVDQSGIQCWA